MRLRNEDLTMRIAYPKDLEQTIDELIKAMLVTSGIVFMQKGTSNEPDMIPYEIEFKHSYFIYVFGNAVGMMGIKSVPQPWWNLNG